ncbi:MAG: helix-turn-helix domain-containing protein [Armatimonadota bacterium]|nr:helix-turn-helix domain-containing protein [Armatimonadota bacterium]MDR7401453.1 helix-turn-helix domain-containing protein [Armatimonadota bacterium]MDR7404710.1 helix-turn-helix domain-containing protein [Armatimonadota bacterium]MDR7437211.1 helix-turn-helix domain-containing protein [Armatimonadota bacterium]MDR7473011.1 helix-turn-helix domain-containing protein [Armatimonadota bacterium]
MSGEPAERWPDLMTVEQVAAYLQVHRMTVYRYIRSGRLPAARVGRVYRVRRADLEAFLDRHRVPGASPVPPRRSDAAVTPSGDPAGGQPPRLPVRDRMLFSLNPLEWVLHSLH